MSGKGKLGVTFGQRTEVRYGQEEVHSESDAQGVIGSEKGDIQFISKGKVEVHNTDLITDPKKKVRAEGTGVSITSGKDVLVSSEGSVVSESGLTLAFSSPVTDAIQSGYEAMEQAKQSKNPKLSGLLKLKAAQEAMKAAQNAGKVAKTLGSLGETLESNGEAAANPAVKIAVGIGGQSQHFHSDTKQVRHHKNSISSGTVELVATEGKVYFEGDMDADKLHVSAPKGIGGAAQSVGGVAATAFGAGLCETGIGCMGGVPLAAYGVDNAVAGAKTIYSGKYHSTIGATALADLTGINPETAELIYSTPSMAFGAKPIAMGATKATGAVANEVVRIGGDVKYVAGELGKDVRAIGGYFNDESAKFGVNVQNSHALTNINNTIPKEYKIAFGINAITGGAVESLYYLDGSKNITKDNLASSTIKVGTNAVYDSLVHKLNPAYGVAADTVKSIVIDNKSITNSINGSLQSSGVSSFIEGGADRLNAPPNMGRFISSFGNKYIEYKEESESKKERK